MPVDIEAMYRKSAIRSTASAGMVLGLGAISPNLAFSNMMTTFALSGIVGYQARTVLKSKGCLTLFTLFSSCMCPNAIHLAPGMAAAAAATTGSTPD